MRLAKRVEKAMGAATERARTEWVATMDPLDVPLHGWLATEALLEPLPEWAWARLEKYRRAHPTLATELPADPEGAALAMRMRAISDDALNGACLSCMWPYLQAADLLWATEGARERFLEKAGLLLDVDDRAELLAMLEGTGWTADRWLSHIEALDQAGVYAVEGEQGDDRELSLERYVEPDERP